MSTYSDEAKQYLQELLKVSKYDFIASGFEKLTITGTSIGFQTIPENSRYALVVVESTNTTTPAVRYLELNDKISPTATNGIPRSNLDAFDIQGYANIVNFRCIQTSAGTHSLSIQYYR